MEQSLPLSAIVPFPANKMQSIDLMLTAACKNSGKKMVVLDDDPTGVQTVHAVSVYTKWDKPSLLQGFEEAGNLFFVLTNSRSFTQEQTALAHKEITENIIWAAEKTNKDFFIISRGDSTLRGHYPLETKVIKQALEQSGKKLDGEIICPYFSQGGRYTINNIHYVKLSQELVPAANTEFAQDKTFGYTHSNLCEYIEEKTNKEVLAKDVLSISASLLRDVEIDKIVSLLLQANEFSKIVVNATDDYDLKVFCIALYSAMEKGKLFCMRTAAAFVNAIGNINCKPLLTHAQLIKKTTNIGGIVIVGSHTKKTTAQLAQLLKLPLTVPVELNAALVLVPNKLQQEAARVTKACEEIMLQGKTAVVFTTRALLSFDEDTPQIALARSVEISDAVSAVVGELQVVPAFVVAKGGITSSDIGTKALSVKKATVLGQICPGVPVWQTGEESKFPDIPYVIFPGNVGEDNTLNDAVKVLINV